MMAHNLIKGKPTNLTAGLAIAKLALELYPESAVVHHRLAEGYEALGDNSRAILHYQKVLELNADNLDVRNSLRKLGSLNKKINLNSP
jgi:Tfp pilus assembly protein PilF